jgi:hypothetical protein
VICRAGHQDAPNYGKAHVPVPGLHDGQPIMSCAYCGRTFQEPAKEQLDKRAELW